MLAYLRELDTETLLVAADEGLMLRREGVEARMAAVRGLRVERLAGGHHLHMENPEAVAEVVGPFLKRD